MNDYKILYSPRSDIMLEAHVEFLSRVSAKASRNLLKEYFIGIENIKLNPYGYPYLDERKIYRRYIFYKRYLIIYLVEKFIIYIEYIVDTRQNYFKNIFKS